MFSGKSFASGSLRAECSDQATGGAETTSLALLLLLPVRNDCGEFGDMKLPHTQSHDRFRSQMEYLDCMKLQECLRCRSGSERSGGELVQHRVSTVLRTSSPVRGRDS